MSFKDLREFISLLEQEGELKRITAEVDPNLEITEIADRCLRNGGPALLFENPKGSSVPCLPIFLAIPSESHWLWAAGSGGSARRWQTAGVFEGTLAPEGLARFMAELAQLQKRPEHASGGSKTAPCQEVVIAEEDVDLGFLPIQTCWPGDADPWLPGLW